MGVRKNAYRVLVGRRPLARLRRRWKDNIKMDLKKLDEGAWTGLIWLRLGTCGELF
jgi:hypothetical protein